MGSRTVQTPTRSAPYRFVPRVVALDEACAVEHVVRALRERPGLVALDSAGGAPARWSVVAFDPLPAGAPPTRVDQLRTYLEQLAPADGDVPGPFHGGFIGALAYDLGVLGETQTLPAPAWDLPKIVGGLYVDFIVVDHAESRAWLVLGEDPGDGRASVRAREAAVRDALQRTLPQPRVEPRGPLERDVTPANYQARIEAVRQAIARGDLYQANLAHRFTRELDALPTDLYARLRRFHPAPYMGYLQWGSGARPSGALLSGSPELLLEFDGVRARTRPIKGTIGRGRDADEDARNKERLLASDKDRAELAMIVDLERNDLGRVARPGSVRVDGFPTVETYASVHHLVADVRCEVRADLDAVDLLGALFPGGSITGAPKLASMDEIARREAQGRGFFTGSLGFLDLRGHACFNILIRTLVWRPTDTAGEVSFHVGAGITWSSDPAAEERETLRKGERLARAVAGEPAEGLGFCEIDEKGMFTSA